LQRQDAAINGFRSKGVEVRPWPNDVLEALKLAWAEVVAEEIEGNPDIGRVWQNYQIFLETYAPVDTTAGRN
jgi:TRAP-type mannitol/chloroaromatic compound transport system substrate-binding protein